MVRACKILAQLASLETPIEGVQKSNGFQCFTTEVTELDPTEVEGPHLFWDVLLALRVKHVMSHWHLLLFIFHQTVIQP